MKLILKNRSNDTFSYLSGKVMLGAMTQTDVISDYWFALYTDETFLRDLTLNNLYVSDGIKDYETPESNDYLKLLNDFNYNNKDTDGAHIVRNKAAKKGWNFWAVPIEITTSTIGGTLYCKNSDDTNISWVTCKIYDGDGAEITVPGLANINLATCIKTVIDFEPIFDFEIIGGALKINANPSQDVRMWIVGAPDIPAQYGGSKEFASGINLKFLTQDNSFEIDGRVTKFLTYNAITHQGKMRIILKHPAGLQVNMQLVVHIYRQ